MKQTSQAVSVEKKENLAIIRFSRPKERNPLSIAVLLELHQILDEIRGESIIIFTGTDDVFASGANLNEIAGVTGETAREYARRGQNLMRKISEIPNQTIAFINGFCFGGGLDLALSCQRRIATPNAVFCHPGANLGIMTGWGGTQKLPRLIGEAKALEMFLTAKRVGAKEALQIGLIDEICENLAEGD
jgi:enoyl-CoA hydratase/carnithine racemase